MTQTVDRPFDTETAGPAMIGASVPRREDDRLLIGRGRFLDDLDMPGALRGGVRPQPPRARPHPVDRHERGHGRARRRRGLHRRGHAWRSRSRSRPRWCIPTSCSTRACRCRRRWCTTSASRSPSSSRPRRYIAEDAVDLIDVDYEELPAVASTAAALAPGAPLGPRRRAATMSPCTSLQTRRRPGGGSRRRAAPAGARRSASYAAAATRWRPGRSRRASTPATGQLTVWDATQAPHYARQHAGVSYRHDRGRHPRHRAAATSAAVSARRRSSTARRR